MRAFFLSVVLFAVSDPLPAQPTIPASQSDLENARDLLNHGHPDQAVGILKKLAAVEPPIMGVEHELGKAFYSIGKLAEARDAFAKAIEQNASDQDSVQMEGLVLYQLGQAGTAITYLERAVHGMPNPSADAQTVLGLCYVRGKRYDDARITYARLFGEPPESGSAYLLFATILRRMDLSEPAAMQAQKALDISPGLPLAHFILGEIALAKSDLEPAAGQFEAEIRIDPDYAPTYERLGEAYMRMENCQRHRWL